MEFDMEKAKAIVVIVITAIANVLNVLGYAFDADAWVNVVLSILAAATMIYAWWKNQNITSEAQQAQQLLDELKASNKLTKAQQELDRIIASR